MKIIYLNYAGQMVIVTPVASWPIHQIAKKDVPYGVPYLIVEDSDLPADWSTSAAWEADFSNPDGIGMGAQRWFIAQAEAELIEISQRTEPSAPVPHDTIQYLNDAGLLEQIDPSLLAIDPELEGDELAARQTEVQQVIAAARAVSNALVDDYNAGVIAMNQAMQQQYEAALAGFYAAKEADTARANALIAQMNAEVFEIEGVQL